MTPPNPSDGSSDSDAPNIEVVPLTAAFASVASALHAKGFDDAWDSDAIIRLLDVPGAFGILAYRPGDTSKNAEDQPLGFVLVQAVLDEAEINTITVARMRGAWVLVAPCLRLSRNVCNRQMLTAFCWKWPWITTQRLRFISNTVLPRWGAAGVLCTPGRRQN